jgi:shikimate kinase
MSGPLNANCNIVLAGPMGSGKTTVGRLVAERLGREFKDTDRLIEDRTGISIVRIFSERSELYFRALEREVVKEIAEQRNLVVAIGGGTIVDEENRRELSSDSLLICLLAATNVLHQRLNGTNHRPLLKGRDLRTRIEEVLRERMSVYRAVEHCIETDRLTVESVADRIVQIYKAEIGSDV